MPIAARALLQRTVASPLAHRAQTARTGVAVNLPVASVQSPGTQCPETAKQKALLSASGASER